MIGGNKSPFRSPCAGSSGVAPAMVIKSALAASLVDAYGNTTQMLDHCGNTITAKARLYQQDTCGNDLCTDDCNDCPGGVDLVTNTPNPPAIGENTFVKNGKVQLVPTRKLAFKIAQAFKAWQGALGFTFDSGTGKDCATSTTRSNTRYLKRTMTASLYLDDNDDPPGQGGFNWAQSRTITINKLSGERTLSDCSDTTDNPFVATKGFIGSDLNTAVNCTTDIQSVVDALAECLATSTGAGGSSGDHTDPVSGFTSLTVSSTRTETNYTWAIDRYVMSSPGVVQPHIEHYVGSITLSEPYTIDDVLADAVTQAGEWNLIDDLEYPFRTDGHTTVAPIVLLNELAASDPNIFPPCSVDDLTAPIDDADGNAPFTTDWAATYSQRAWFDPAAYSWVFASGETQATAAATGLALLYDGSIIGTPLPAGYGQPVGGNPQGVFDRDHENWFRKNCVDGVGWSQASESRGAFTPLFLPTNATKWTDDFNATTLYPCEFINADLNGVYLQKGSEIQIPRPSINFARPFGPDKFLLDETAVFFMADNTAGVITLKNTDFSTPTGLPFGTGDIVGGASVGGFYQISALGSDTLTLGTKVYNVPAGWQSKSGDTSACFGRMLYPDAPGMDFIDETLEVGGRVAVTVTNNSPAILTTATVQKYLSITAPENCDILDGNMVFLANSVLTRMDDTHFTTTTGFASIETAKWIVPHGATDKYKFADSRSKGDYVFRTWLVSLDTESVLEHSQTDNCLATSPCGPSVAVVTPNGETPGNGNRHDFPSSINNGELWLGQVQMWMQDPFWQQPHTPVASDSLGGYVGGTDIMIWREDDGSCAADSKEAGGGGENIYHMFYPQRPYVEARCTVPTISGTAPPALPVDITTVADPVPQASIADAEGPLVNAISLPVPRWITYLAEKQCVDGAGRFTNDYQANGT